jgi:predicted transposase YdaD
MRTVSLYTIYRQVRRELSQDLFYQKLKDEAKKLKDEEKKLKDEEKFKSYTVVKNLLDLNIDISKISKETGYSIRKISAITNNRYTNSKI